MADNLNTLLERIATALEALAAAAATHNHSETGSKDEAAKLLGISPKTLERRIKNGDLIENCHWWLEGKRLVFDMELLRDYQRNKTNPIAHQRAIEIRRQQLLSQRNRRA
jgi:hypothetical protein